MSFGTNKDQDPNVKDLIAEALKEHLDPLRAELKAAREELAKVQPIDPEAERERMDKTVQVQLETLRAADEEKRSKARVNAAFIPITGDQRDKITEGKSFISLSEIHAANVHLSSADSMVANFGLDVNTGALKAQKRKEVPITNHAQLFLCITTWLHYHSGSDNLSKALEAHAFLAIVADYLNNYTLMAVLNAVEGHRRRMISESLSLLELTETAPKFLLAIHALPKKACGTCGTTELHAAADPCPFRNKRPGADNKDNKPDTKRFQYCGDYNSTKGCSRNPCRFDHRCKFCKSFDCKKPGYCKSE
jgi:hypothetical protein